MEDVCGVDVLEGGEDLVGKVLEMLIGEDLSARDNLMEVGIHETGDNVNVLEVWAGSRRNVDVFDGDDVVVLEVAEKFHFAECSFAVDDVFDDARYLLYGDFFAGEDVLGGTDYSVGALTDGLD